MSRWPILVGVGTATGAVIAYVDNFAFGGEVSPVAIVAMLLAATATTAAIWGGRAWMAATAAWACVPLVHVVKHALGLPDTLHPNTYASILYLAAFLLVVAGVGTCSGLLVRRLAIGGESRRV